MQKELHVLTVLVTTCAPEQKKKNSTISNVLVSSFYLLTGYWTGNTRELLKGAGKFGT